MPALAHNQEEEDESNHVICIDSKDADDAAQVIGRLIETHSKQIRSSVVEGLTTKGAPAIPI